MALINCPECNKEVSDKAEVCPNCGFGVAKYVVRQNKIEKIQKEAEKEAYLYVKQKKKEEKEAAERKKKEEKEKAEREKRAEENRKNRIYDEAVNKYKSEFSKDVKAAEELFSTISGWKDSDTYLNKCEDRISELRQREALQEEKCKKRNKKIIIATVITGICLGLIVGSYNYYKKVIVPPNVYESAMHSIQSEDYEDAIEKLKTITDYKDAKDDVNELIIMCENALKYEEAVDLAKKDKYIEAISILEDIEGFKDSANILAQYRLEADYLDAVTYADSGNYESAILLFENLGDYKDAKEKNAELCYQFGINEFENKNYINAKKYLEKVSDNKDVASILSECELQLSYADLYSTAQALLAEGNAHDALNYLKKLPSDYKDGEELILFCDEYKDILGTWVEYKTYFPEYGKWFLIEDVKEWGWGASSYLVTWEAGQWYVNGYTASFTNNVFCWSDGSGQCKLDVTTGEQTSKYEFHIKDNSEGSKSICKKVE